MRLRTGLRSACAGALLPGHIAIQLALPCLCVIGTITGISALAGVGPRPTSESGLTAQATMLLIIAYFALTPGRPSASIRGLVGIAAQLAIAGIVVFVLCVSEQPTPPSRARLGWVGALSVAAFVEELVFRVLLPARLEHNLRSLLDRRSAETLAVTVSQAAFAASHFLRGPAASVLGASDFLQLFVSGIALWAIIQCSRVWPAASLHAIANISLMRPPGARETATPAMTSLWILGGVCLARVVFRLPSWANWHTLRGRMARPTGLGES